MTFKTLGCAAVLAAIGLAAPIAADKPLFTDVYSPAEFAAHRAAVMSRIGDGVAPFYNYIYCTVAGFTENDTFRSNQIRNGDISRAEALERAMTENIPRIDGLDWYFRRIGLDMATAMSAIIGSGSPAGWAASRRRNPSGARISARSMPELNDSPAPETITHRTSGSADSSRPAAASSAHIRGVCALWRCGRARVTRRIGPFPSTRISVVVTRDSPGRSPWR